MGKRKSIFVIVIIIISIMIIWFYKNNNIYGKITDRENEAVISLVNSYYDDIMSKDFKGALLKIDLSKEDYNRDLEIWNNRKDYTIQQVNDGYWTISVNGRHDYVSYDQENKCFEVNTVIRIMYKSIVTEENQVVYIKRFKKENFKIINILAPKKDYKDCSYFVYEK